MNCKCFSCGRELKPGEGGFRMENKDEEYECENCSCVSFLLGHSQARMPPFSGFVEMSGEEYDEEDEGFGGALENGCDVEDKEKSL